MEALIDVLKYIATSAIGGGFGWFYSKWHTKREKKETDLELIGKAIDPLLRSFNELTTHIGQITDKLVAEQTKNLKLLQENAKLLEEKGDLMSKVESLEKKVQTLTNMVKKLAHEKNPDIPTD